MENNIKNTKNDNCKILPDFIYNVSKTQCTDYYLETGRSDDMYELFDYDKLGYLDLCNSFFHLFKYLHIYEKTYNVELSGTLFTNIRYHEINIRLYSSRLENYDYIQNTIEEINKKFVNSNQLKTDIIYYCTDYIKSFIKSYFQSKMNNTQYHITRTLSNSYSNIFYEYPQDIQNIIFVKQLDIMFKQYTKSIFYGKDIDVILNCIDSVNLLELNPINIKEFVTNTDEYLFFYIENININIYTLLRMFIKKDGWDINKHAPENYCSAYSYPKNIIVSMGNAHITWINNFIKYYFSLEKVLIKSEFEYDLKHLSSQITDEEYDKLRCIKIPPNSILFE